MGNNGAIIELNNDNSTSAQGVDSWLEQIIIY